MARPLKIGIMGGSFDPPHLVHIKIAQAAREALNLDEVFFIPANQAPLKGFEPRANFGHRLNMLKLALESVKGAARVLDLELLRGGTSYSVDTARILAREHPNANFYWIIGADQVESLHKWKDIEELARLVEFACFERPGFSLKPNTKLPPLVRIHKIGAEPIGVSSTKIRKMLAHGVKKIEYLDEKVLNYARENKLYIAP